MRNEDILAEVDRRFQDQREFIKDNFTHISAVMQTGFELARDERQAIKERVDMTNGRVTKLEDKGVRYDRHMDNADGLKKHYKYLIPGFFVVVFLSVLLSAWIIDNNLMIEFLKLIKP